MKILVVSPPTFGKNSGASAKDTFTVMELLRSMGHEVVLQVIGVSGQHEPLIKEFSETNHVPVHVFVPNMKNWLNWLSFVFLKSFGYADRASYVFGQLVEDGDFKSFVDGWKPDALISFCSYSWPVVQFAREKNIPSVFRSHNYEPSFFWESLNPIEMCIPSNWVRYIAKRIGEHNAVFFSNATATLPFADITRYRRWKPENIFILTVTFPYNTLAQSWVHRGKKPLDVFYLGASYLVRFHLRGARALIEDIAPEVGRRAPGAFRFHICGSKLPKELKDKCGSEKIIYEGYVPDLDAFLDRMDIGAFPVWTGKVMKGKVFESLCRAFPIVIPQNCLGGYVLKDGDEVLMAETKEAFVEAILSLRSDALRQKLSRGAAAFAKDNFSYETLTGVLTQALDHAMMAP
jgi:glycosyltransferase involved in cell wall biosynthesis